MLLGDNYGNLHEREGIELALAVLKETRVEADEFGLEIRPPDELFDVLSELMPQPAREASARKPAD